MAAFHISVLTNAQYFEEAVRIQGWGAFLFSIAAILAALIVVPISTYHIRDMAQNPSHPLAWLFMGAGFGILTPLFAGGFNRAAARVYCLAEGIYGIGDMPSLMLDAILIFLTISSCKARQMCSLDRIRGDFRGCRVVIDRLNVAKNENVSRWCPWIAACSIGLVVLLFALLGPNRFPA